MSAYNTIISSFFLGFSLFMAPVVAYAKDVKDIRLAFIIYTDPTVTFWAPTLQGVKDAEEQLGVSVDVYYAGESPEKQNQLIRSAIDNQVDGIALTIFNDSAFNQAICDAEAADITVIAFNQDHTKGHLGSCRSAFVGQNETLAADVLSRRMVKDLNIQAGDMVLAAVEFPNATYAQQRIMGANKAIKSVGADMHVIGTTANIPNARDLMAQHLTEHPYTKAILALGHAPAIAAPKAIQDVGLKTPIGAFDLSSEIGQAIKNKIILATVDQQPYQQGYYTVHQLVLAKKFGLAPVDMDTSGGSLVDDQSVDYAFEHMGHTR